jgi:type I restriction enzyme, R subunit
MAKIGQKERVTQNRVVAYFRDVLGYTSLGDREHRVGNSNIEEAELRAYLSGPGGYSEAVIARALHQLKQAAGQDDLYDANNAVYQLLRYGVKVKPELGEQTITVWLINWNNVLANRFGVAEEVTVAGPHVKRPDVVLYVNGLALGVLELKRSSVSIGEGIRQNISSQKKEFIQPFFSTMQLVMAGNDSQGLMYGTIQTPEKYYLRWKEDGHSPDPTDPHPLDTELSQMCRKERLLELLHDFVVFDYGVKKLCRPNQYFGVKAAQRAVRDGRGGVIWHTQGSGKSLTMVWLAHWILENVVGSRVLIITDRTELDEQIEGVFHGVGETMKRTRNGAELLSALANPNPPLLCSLVHKFGTQEEGDIEAFVRELRQGSAGSFKPHGRFFVFVDECHRTQSGKLHDAMKALLPDATLIGFTGTPLLRSDKARSIEVFGPYIHTYKFTEAVRDGVVLDLKYEARDIDQDLTSPDKVDRWFEAKTRGLTDVARSKLKQRWGTMQKVLSSKDRLSKIVADILIDMEEKPRLSDQRGNAMLVTDSVYQACRLYELFQAAGFEQCAIITSYQGHIADTKTADAGSGAGQTEELLKYEVYQKMLGGKTPKEFETHVKQKFIKEPGQMRLLIVVDKLLTGFDAPPATYLYIDKRMRDHALFQAICRVNRLDGDDKEYGYIVDYKDLFGRLGEAFTDYTSGAFEDYDEADVQGLLQDRLSSARQRLEDRLEDLRALCEPVAPPRDQAAYFYYFCGDTSIPDDVLDTSERRVLLYKLVGGLVRAYADLAGELEDAQYTAAEAHQIAAEVKRFDKLKDEVMIHSGDYLDFKQYEADMRHLLDTYVRADESRVITTLQDMTLLDLLIQEGPAAVTGMLGGNQAAVAETIENNVRRVINAQQVINPQFFEQMSVVLSELIAQRKAEAVEYEVYLAQMVEAARQAQSGSAQASYPPSICTAGQRALFDNLQPGLDASARAEFVERLDKLIRDTRKDNWRSNPIKRRELRRGLRQMFPDDESLSAVMNLIEAQAEY